METFTRWVRLLGLVLGKKFKQVTSIEDSHLRGTLGTSFFSSLNSAGVMPCAQAEQLVPTRASAGARAATSRRLGKHKERC